MTLRVYVVRGDRTKITPISEAEWLTALGRVPDLEIREVENRKQHVTPYAELRGEPRQWLGLSMNGVVEAQRPGESLVRAMFALARLLDAQVVNAKLKPYASVEDWERKTRHERVQLEDALRRERTRRWLRRAGFACAVGAVVMLLRWLFG